MIYWVYREEPDLIPSAEHELIICGGEGTDDKTGQLLHQIWFMMAKVFTSSFPQQVVHWYLYHCFSSWGLAIA